MTNRGRLYLTILNVPIDVVSKRLCLTNALSSCKVMPEFQRQAPSPTGVHVYPRPRWNDLEPAAAITDDRGPFTSSTQPIAAALDTLEWEGVLRQKKTGD